MFEEACMFQVITIKHEELQPLSLPLDQDFRDIEVYRYSENGLHYRCVVRSALDVSDLRFRKEMEFQEYIRTPGHPAIPPIYAFARVEYPDRTFRPATIEDMVTVVPLRFCIERAREFLHDTPVGTLPILLPPGFVLYILSEVASGLAYLHKKDIVARSVHPDKLGIIAETMTVRFLTMQSFREDGGEQLTLYARNPFNYACIDSFTPPDWEDRISPAWDTWSLAVLGYYLLTGEEILDSVQTPGGLVLPRYDEQSIREKLRVLRRTLRKRFGIEHMVDFFEIIFLSSKMRQTPIRVLQDILVTLEARYGHRTAEIRAISRLLTSKQTEPLSVHQTIFNQLMRGPSSQTSSRSSSHTVKKTSQNGESRPTRRVKPRLQVRFGRIGRALVSACLRNARDFQIS